ncbi:MAG: serine/threonine protein kinase [Deltaproteobacteria bacterium]|nr:serine/threonine protein kinase [Deltaproteobacteria bacterium]
MTPENTPAADPRLGALLEGKYRVCRLIGRGGMGAVYEAEHTGIGRRVAVKFLHTSALSDATSTARFQREARAISAVESAHIVQVFDWGQDDAGQPFLVMELCEGKDLGERIKQLGKLCVADAVRYAIEALRGLRRAHAAGIVHRDLKPDNLLLVLGDDDRLHVKIVDFGLSKLMEPEQELQREGAVRLTQQGALVGTPLYMSPEQIEATETIDQRTDIWSMGVILYEALAGSPPFMEQSYAGLLMAICRKDPPELRKLVPEVPADLCLAVHKALSRDRAARFQSADELLEALESFAASSLRAVRRAAPAASDEPVPASPAPGAVTPSGRETPVPATPAVPSSGGPLDATLAVHTRGAATVWLADAPAFSIWRGEVDAPDRLRIEARDGSFRDLRLEPVGVLRLGRAAQVGDEHNELVYPDVASRLAAVLRHDGVRWWLQRRKECSVPVQVGTRPLGREEAAPMVHGTVVTVGGMRASLVDRRYVLRSVPAGTVDPLSGLLARAGLEQEIATALQQGRGHGLVLVHLAAGPGAERGPLCVRAAVAVHRRWPSLVVAREEDTVATIVRGDDAALREHGRIAAEVARAEGATVLGCGYWTLEGEAANAGRELELALNALMAASGPAAPLVRARGGPDTDGVVALRALQQDVRLSTAEEVLAAAQHPKHQMLLFAIEDQGPLRAIGPAVIDALEQELAAVVSTQVGPSALVSRLAPGVLGASVPRKLDAATLGVSVQCEWHARPPVTDGRVELARTLSWEQVVPGDPRRRAEELSAECSEAHGVLSALSGGLPYPVAGRVYGAISASSAVERVKMLFDVLEGTWRLIAVVLACAYFAKAAKDGGDHQAMAAFFERTRSRAGLPLGSWRELARVAAKSFEGATDPIGELVRQLLDVKLTPNQTFDTLSNLMQAERNSFAHGHYGEARAAADVAEFEQMTRTILRALRPLCAWTLITMQRTDPELYGEVQSVEFIDHTGPYQTGARRRIGFNSPIRLANVVYIARWRDGLVLPLDPLMRRLAAEDRFELYWMDHLPRPGPCAMSAVVSGEPISAPCDARRLPPLLRRLAGVEG